MMNLRTVEHILRAAGDATKQRDFVLIGSAAIFVWRTTVPRTMSMSREADIYADVADPDEAERIADELDAILGQASRFDETHGYYCDGVGPETAIFPGGWRERAMLFTSANTNGVTALVPQPEDIAAAKLCAGRDKDMAWLVAATESRIIDLDIVEDRLDLIPPERGVDSDILAGRLLTVRSRAGE